MSESYYIRIRGRVHGPMDTERLKELVAKGQLSRSHELSQDSTSWITASKMPELFERTKPIKKQAVGQTQQQPQPQPQPHQQPHQQPQQQPQQQFESGDQRLMPSVGMPPGYSPNPNSVGAPGILKEWHYTIQGTQNGPVSVHALSEMIRHRLLAREDLVWKQGMGQWMPAGFVPEFVVAFTNSSRSESDSFGMPKRERKSKLVAIILALLLGVFGVHHFYLGNPMRGLIMILLLFFFIGAILNPLIVLVEILIFICCTDAYFQKAYCNRAMG